MTIPDIAVGAVGAALIGAVISLMGLIVSKEAKISEFREAWIDSLRSELSAFLTNANAVVDLNGLEIEDNNTRFEKAQPFYGKLNEAYYLVALRLNSKEANAKKLKSCMVAIGDAVRSPDRVDQRQFDLMRVDFINCSNALLKAEWKRVKSGELTFKMTKWLAGAAVVALLALATVIVIREPARKGLEDVRIPPPKPSSPIIGPKPAVPIRSIEKLKGP